MVLKSLRAINFYVLNPVQIVSAIIMMCCSPVNITSVNFKSSSLSDCLLISNSRQVSTCVTSCQANCTENEIEADLLSVSHNKLSLNAYTILIIFASNGCSYVLQLKC